MTKLTFSGSKEDPGISAGWFDEKQSRNKTKGLPTKGVVVFTCNLSILAVVPRTKGVRVQGHRQVSTSRLCHVGPCLRNHPPISKDVFCPEASVYNSLRGAGGSGEGIARKVEDVH